MIRGLGQIGTLESDRDQGVIRVSQWILKQLRSDGDSSARNVLVRVTVADGSQRPKSLVRIVRAATASRDQTRKALSSGSIALQYDDQVALGIADRSEPVKLRIERSPIQIWDQFRFLYGHTSASIRLAFTASVLIAAISLAGGPILSIMSEGDAKGLIGLLVFGPICFSAGVLMGRLAEWRITTSQPKCPCPDT